MSISSFVGSDVDFAYKSGRPAYAPKSAVNTVNAGRAADFRKKTFVFSAINSGFVKP